MIVFCCLARFSQNQPATAAALASAGTLAVPYTSLPPVLDSSRDAIFPLATREPLLTPADFPTAMPNAHPSVEIGVPSSLTLPPYLSANQGEHLWTATLAGIAELPPTLHSGYLSSLAATPPVKTFVPPSSMSVSAPPALRMPLPPMSRPGAVSSALPSPKSPAATFAAATAVAAAVAALPPPVWHFPRARTPLPIPLTFDRKRCTIGQYFLAWYLERGDVIRLPPPNMLPPGTVVIGPQYAIGDNIFVCPLPPYLPRSEMVHLKLYSYRLPAVWSSSANIDTTGMFFSSYEFVCVIFVREIFLLLFGSSLSLFTNAFICRHCFSTNLIF
jgi:hypothetical protein